MVIKRNRREARQYAFQMLYANEFHVDQNDVQFPEGHMHKSMDKAYANSIIMVYYPLLKLSMLHYNHSVNHVKLKTWIKLTVLFYVLLYGK